MVKASAHVDDGTGVGAVARFPLTPGTRRGRNYMSALTMTHAVMAWLLSRPYNGHPMRLFREPLRG